MQARERFSSQRLYPFLRDELAITASHSSPGRLYQWQRISKGLIINGQIAVSRIGAGQQIGMAARSRRRHRECVAGLRRVIVAQVEVDLSNKLRQVRSYC